MFYYLAGFFFAAGLVSGVRYLHMCQLCSYQWPGYRRWLREHGGEAFIPMAPLVVLVLMGLWDSPIAKGIGCAALLAALLLSLPRKPAKKPLVWTARAIRLFVTYGLCILILLTGAWFLQDYHRFLCAWLGAAFLALPYGMGAANAATLPLQKRIQKRYIQDARRILQSHPGLTVIGVTGSFGKTSVKFYLTALLSARYNVLCTPESYNTPMGVVKTIRERLRPFHEFFICEMGARHAGDIREICEIVNPKHGVITAVGEQHLETFHTLDTIVKTKFELAEALPPEGMLFLNTGSPPIASRKADWRAQTISYAVSSDARFSAHDITADVNGSQFCVTMPDGRTYRYTTALLGRHQIENILGAVAAACSLGVMPDELAAPIRALKPAPHRLALSHPAPGFWLIDDAYNANPQGAAAALEALALFENIQKILITPGMVELGDAQDAHNEALGRQAAQVCDAVVLVGAKQTAAIRKGLGDFPGVQVAENVRQAFAYAKALPGDKVVLLLNDLPDQY